MLVKRVQEDIAAAPRIVFADKRYRFASRLERCIAMQRGPGAAAVGGMRQVTNSWKAAARYRAEYLPAVKRADKWPAHLRQHRPMRPPPPRSPSPPTRHPPTLHSKRHWVRNQSSAFYLIHAPGPYLPNIAYSENANQCHRLRPALINQSRFCKRSQVAVRYLFYIYRRPIFGEDGWYSWAVDVVVKDFVVVRMA